LWRDNAGAPLKGPRTFFLSPRGSLSLRSVVRKPLAETRRPFSDFSFRGGRDPPSWEPLPSEENVQDRSPLGGFFSGLEGGCSMRGLAGFPRWSIRSFPSSRIVGVPPSLRRFLMRPSFSRKSIRCSSFIESISRFDPLTLLAHFFPPELRPFSLNRIHFFPSR